MISKKSQSVLLSLLAASLLGGCATSQVKKEDVDRDMEAMRKEIGELRNQLNNTSGKVESLDTKTASLNDKVDANKVNVDLLMGKQKPKTAMVSQPLNDSLGVEVAAQPAESDPQAGFVQDQAVFAYRQARILFQAKKYPEAVLAYSAFVERYPDHALAGAAQFYVGESYYNQKEFKLAVREYQRVLTTYDRSAYVADTLRQMAASEDQLKQSAEAAKHRQMLLALFPQSPAAAQSKDTPSRILPSTESEKGYDKESEKASSHSQFDEPPPTAPALQGVGH